jgi:biopolymer transport protein ExbB/TolQ
VKPWTKQRGLFGLSSLGLISSGIVIVTVLAAFAGQALVLRRAQNEKATLELQLSAMTKDRDQAVKVAQANAQTIVDLQREKADLEKANVEIEKARVQAETERSNREAVIAGQANTASSRATTPKVIADVIQSIQAERNRRPR